MYNCLGVVWKLEVTSELYSWTETMPLSKRRYSKFTQVIVHYKWIRHAKVGFCDTHLSHCAHASFIRTFTQFIHMQLNWCLSLTDTIIHTSYAKVAFSTVEFEQKCRSRPIVVVKA